MHHLQIEDALFSYIEWTVAPLLNALSGASARVLDRKEKYPELVREDEHFPTIEELLLHCTKQKICIDRLEIGELHFNVTARVSLPILNSFDGTPLAFAATSMRDVFAFPDQLLKDLAANYVADTIVRSPLLLMSLNILGNPA